MQRGQQRRGKARATATAATGKMLDQLGRDELLLVASNAVLGADDLFAIGQVCRALRTICQDDRLWRTQAIRKWTSLGCPPVVKSWRKHFIARGCRLDFFTVNEDHPFAEVLASMQLLLQVNDKHGKQRHLALSFSDATPAKHRLIEWKLPGTDWSSFAWDGATMHARLWRASDERMRNLLIAGSSSGPTAAIFPGTYHGSLGPYEPPHSYVSVSIRLTHKAPGELHQDGHSYRLKSLKQPTLQLRLARMAHGRDSASPLTTILDTIFDDDARSQRSRAHQMSQKYLHVHELLQNPAQPAQFGETEDEDDGEDADEDEDEEDDDEEDDDDDEEDDGEGEDEGEGEGEAEDGWGIPDEDEDDSEDEDEGVDADEGNQGDDEWLDSEGFWQ